ncbi:MAG: L,D-transpeptidase [Cellulosilyticaceae bacterium]
MKKIVGVILCYLIIVFPIFANPTISSKALGTLEKNNTVLNFGGYTIETYKALDGIYVPVSRLKDAGLTVHFTPGAGTIQIDSSTSNPPPTHSPSTLEGKPFTLYENDIWVGPFRSHGVVTDGKVLIPIGALRSLYDINIENNSLYHMSSKTPINVIASKNTIINHTEYPLSISVIDLYWDNGWVKENHDLLVNAGETLTRPASLHAKQYVSTIITKLVSQTPDNSLNYTNSNMFGQLNDRLFKSYSRIESIGDLSDIGDPIDIDTLLWAEDTINSKHLSSSTPYLVWTNIAKQRTYIFQGSKDNWKLIKHFKCSTGRAGAATPKGQYKLTYKVPYFGVEKGYRCKNAFGFIGTTYLYHSVMFDKTGTYLLQGKGSLGKPASAGCIRLSVEHSEWFYNNMISKTTVLID